MSLSQCRATRRNLGLALLIVVLQLIVAARARADESRNLSLELKPLPTLMSLVPGGTGVGVAAEARVFAHLSIFADVYHMRRVLTDQAVEDVQDDHAEDEGVARETSVTFGNLGVRYYGRPTGDSWYLGLKAGGGPSRVEWAYGPSRLEERRTTVAAQGEAGYLWTWDSGVLVRMGVGLGWSTTRNRQVASASTSGAALDAARADLDDRNPTGISLATSFDLGLGYRF